jgi:crotonobetainyl-CoA:carnitine CoA-transferase CaiB-like acyl-CoA transferase
MLTYPAIWNLNGDFEPSRTHHSAHPSLVPFQAFQAGDGWIVVACPKEKFWQRLAAAVGRPELATDESFATFTRRRQNAGELLPILDEIFASESVEHWLELLRAAGVPCGPVNSVSQALADDHTVARGMVVETEHPHFGTVRQVRSPVRVGPEVTDYRRAPQRNEDEGYVFSELLGYDAERIERLTTGAVVEATLVEEGTQK